MSYEKYKINIPEGKAGDWEVKQFTVSEDNARLGMLRSTYSFSSRGRCTPTGTYTSLTHRGTTIMSDTPDEIRDHFEMIRMAKGSVLINGLGLGVVLKAVLEKPEVTDATVIELSPEVIELVGKHYQDKYGTRVQIINADAFTYKSPKGRRYGAVWHDIWDSICTSNIPEMHKLHRKYGSIADWQGSWCRWQCERNRREGR